MHTYTHLHTRSLSHLHTLTHTHTHSHLHTLTLTHLHTLTVTHTLTHTLTLTQSHTLSHSHTHTHTHSHTLTVPRPLLLSVVCSQSLTAVASSDPAPARGTKRTAQGTRWKGPGGSETVPAHVRPPSHGGHRAPGLRSRPGKHPDGRQHTLLASRSSVTTFYYVLK